MNTPRECQDFINIIYCLVDKLNYVLNIESLLSLGKTNKLEDEIDKLRSNKTTSRAFTKESLDPQGTTNVLEFLVDSIRPLVSVIAKIDPSPDWFIGVYDVDLCDRTSGEWFKTKPVQPVYAYDAGTDSGTQFISSDKPTSPPRDISCISSDVLKPWTEQKRKFGVFHFSRESAPQDPTTTGEFESDETIKCPNKASKGDVLTVTVLFLSLLFATLCLRL